MWIESLVLKNYRQYKDETIDFSQPGSKGFTIIQGANGVGKTNILNSITWCLYGEELHIANTKYSGLPIYNTKSINEIAYREQIAVEVSIMLSINDKEKMQITRTLKYYKDDNGKISKLSDPTSDSKDGSKLTVMRLIKRNWEAVIDPSFVVGKTIPGNLEEYFFFDGEKLDRYFRESSGENIRQAVLRISQIDLLDRVIDHLRSKRGELIKAERSLSPQAKEMGETLTALTKAREEYAAGLEKKRKQKLEAEGKEREYRDLLKTCTVSNISEREKERQHLLERVKTLQDEVEGIEEDRFDYLTKKGPYVLSYVALKKYHNLIEDTISSGQLPPEYRKSFITSLLKNNKCIFGTALCPNSKERYLVEEYEKDISTISELEQELLKDNGILAGIIESNKSVGDELGRFARNLERVNNDLTTSSERLQTVSDLIKDCNVEEIQRWERAVDEYRSLTLRLVSEISQGEVKLQQADREINRQDEELKKELGKEKKHGELVKKLSFCDESLVAAEQIKKTIVDDVRSEIESVTQEHFLKLIWKKATYKEVKIDESYNVSVRDFSGNDAIGTLSAGERQVLALSFVSALNNVSGFDIPLVIDTPLARISKAPREEIARNLPQYMEGRQVILLVTEEEYTTDVRKALLDNVGKEYMIKFKESLEGGESKVVAR